MRSGSMRCPDDGLCSAGGHGDATESGSRQAAHPRRGGRGRPQGTAFLPQLISLSPRAAPTNALWSPLTRSGTRQQQWGIVTKSCPPAGKGFVTLPLWRFKRNAATELWQDVMARSGDSKLTLSHVPQEWYLSFRNQL
jgi:hypothetical protein